MAQTGKTKAQILAEQAAYEDDFYRAEAESWADGGCLEPNLSKMTEKTRLYYEAQNIESELANELCPVTCVDETGGVIDVPAPDDTPLIRRLRRAQAEISQRRILLAARGRSNTVALQPRRHNNAAPRRTRQRGAAGRSAAGRSSAASGDSGDGGDGEPPRPRSLPTHPRTTPQPPHSLSLTHPLIFAGGAL